MKIKPFFYTFTIAALGTFIFMKTRKRLFLDYEKNTGRLVINSKQKMTCCAVVHIEKIAIHINGEEFDTLYYKHGEMVLDGPVILDLPEAEPGDFIKVYMTTRCSKLFTNKGSLEVY
jgi:hypothetical protein